MRFNSRVAIAACALAPLMLAGCNNSGSGSGGSATTSPGASGGGAKQISLAFVTNNSSDYWTICHKGVDKAASELPGVNVQFIMPDNGSAATQITDVGDLIAKGVQGIAISPVDPANETPKLNDWATKVKLLTSDSDAPQSNRMCYIGTDNHAAGLMEGGLIKQAIPQGGQIMLFVGDPDAQNAHDRIQGVTDALKGSNIQILGTLSDNTDHAAAQTNVANTLTKYPNIAGLVGIWSYNGPQIATAVKNAGKVGKVKIICFDSDPGTPEGIASGVIYASVVQQPYVFGYKSIHMLDDLVTNDGKANIPASKQIFIPTEALTKANIASYEAQQKKLLGGS
jgi:ribose transport system substrate-binding protein